MFKTQNNKFDFLRHFLFVYASHKNIIIYTVCE